VRSEQLVGLLVRFATTFAWGASTRDVVEHVDTQLTELLPGAAVGLLHTLGGGQHHLIASRDAHLREIEGLPLELGEGPGLTAVETGEHVALVELARDRTMPTFSRAAHRSGARAAFAFPFGHAGRRVGAIELYAAEPVALHPHDLDGAQQLADVVGSYVVIAEAREAAVTAAARLAGGGPLHDPLTSLPGRRLLHDRLEQTVRRADRVGRPFGLLRCDIDDFGRFNHRYGHIAGDRLLTEVASRIRTRLRPDDTLARIAGDEFVVTCDDVPDTPHLDELATRVTGAFEGGVDVGAGRRLGVTVSVGQALGGAGHGTVEQVLTRAGVGLSRSKRRRPAGTTGATVTVGGTGRLATRGNS
jgi:diguanylate cyclase (GGDEF)-like protein